MAARDMEITKSKRTLHLAAVHRERVRVRGVVVDVGDGFSGTYRNRWTQLSVAGVGVRCTATPSSPLGTAPVGAMVDVALTFTGTVDVSENVYFAERAQLLELQL